MLKIVIELRNCAVKLLDIGIGGLLIVDEPCVVIRVRVVFNALIFNIEYFS